MSLHVLDQKALFSFELQNMIMCFEEFILILFLCYSLLSFVKFSFCVTDIRYITVIAVIFINNIIIRCVRIMSLCTLMKNAQLIYASVSYDDVIFVNVRSVKFLMYGMTINFFLLYKIFLFSQYFLIFLVSIWIFTNNICQSQDYTRWVPFYRYQEITVYIT